mmetsp:Transcript_32601/g.92432  ORF Transcript_32601/g.92432 Transcript_32601/m.92432 type:complete len:189 (+) Transcript_32601:336-902(+)
MVNLPLFGRKTSPVKRWADKNAPWLTGKVAVALLLWAALLFPWYYAKFTGGVVPIGAVLMGLGQAVPALQMTASNVAATLGSFGLMKGMDVLNSFVGITSLGLAAVPLAACIGVYVVSALLTTTRLGFLDGISYKHTSYVAAGGAAGAGLIAAAAGPCLPGPGLLWAGAASWWSLECSEALDKASKRK